MKNSGFSRIVICLILECIYDVITFYLIYYNLIHWIVILSTFLTQLEELQHDGGKPREPKTEKAAQSVPGQDEGRDLSLRRSTSLLSELQEDSLATSAMV